MPRLAYTYTLSENRHPSDWICPRRITVTSAYTKEILVDQFDFCLSGMPRLPILTEIAVSGAPIPSGRGLTGGKQRERKIRHELAKLSRQIGWLDERCARWCN